MRHAAGCRILAIMGSGATSPTVVTARCALAARLETAALGPFCRQPVPVPGECPRYLRPREGLFRPQRRPGRDRAAGCAAIRGTRTGEA